MRDFVRAWYENTENINEMERSLSSGLKQWERETAARIPKGAKILDIGCGMGREAFALADMGFRVVGADISAKAIRRVTRLAAEKGRDIAFAHCGGRRLPFADASFDAVILWSQTFGLLYGKARQRRMLRECRRVLVKGGLLSFSGHDRAYIASRYPNYLKDGRFYPYPGTAPYWEAFCPGDLTARARGAGYHVLLCEKGAIYKPEDGTVLHCLCQKPRARRAGTPLRASCGKAPQPPREKEMITQRLTLRRFRTDDLDDFVSLIRDKMSSAYSAYDEQFPTDRENLADILAYFVTSDEFFAVSLNEQKRVIGFLSLNEAAPGARNLGYCIHSAFQRRGYGREAVSAAIDYAKLALGCSRLVCGTAEANLPSVKLLRGMGFTCVKKEQASFVRDAAGNPVAFTACVFERAL